MNFQVFIVVLFLYEIDAKTKINVDELRCLVCENSLKELVKAVRNIDPDKTIGIGGYRLDAKGNFEQKTVPQAKSEIHLSELVEEICEKMDDYVRATWKSNGKLTLLQLIVNGKMNSDMSAVDIIQDDDLNKSLKYYCEGIMEENEEVIIKQFQNDVADIPTKVCYEETKLCLLPKMQEEL